MEYVYAMREKNNTVCQWQEATAWAVEELQHNMP